MADKIYFPEKLPENWAELELWQIPLAHLEMLGVDPRQSETYCCDDDALEWTPVYETGIPVWEIDPSWKDDPLVGIDLATLDYHAFKYDDVDDDPVYWQKLLGRETNDRERNWLCEIRLYQEQRDNMEQGRVKPDYDSDMYEGVAETQSIPTTSTS